MAFEPVRPGQPIAARPLRLLARWTEALMRLSGGGGLAVQDGPSGPQLADARPRRFKVLLAGTTSPYAMAETMDTAGGGHATVAGGRSCSACAYERNALGGLSNKVVWVEADAFGAYRFLFHRQNTSSSPCPLGWTVTFTVLACGCPLPGATVTYTGPASGSGTTNAAGQYIVSLPAGTYTWHASDPRFVTGSNRTLIVGPSTPCTAGDTQTLVLADLTRWCGADFSVIPTTLNVVLNNSTAYDGNDRGQTYTVGNLVIAPGNQGATWTKPVNFGAHTGHIDVTIVVDCTLHGSSATLNYSTSFGTGVVFTEPLSAGTAVNPISFTTNGTTGVPPGSVPNPMANIT